MNGRINAATRTRFRTAKNETATLPFREDGCDASLRQEEVRMRNDRKLESMTLVDIASTLQLITDQFADIGRKVAYDSPEHVMATGRPDNLHRSVTNLVENAVRFGGEAAIRLRVAADQLTIDVEDDGPGISDAQKKNVLEPFVRGDNARNMDESRGLRSRPFDRQRHRARAWWRAVAARPAAARTGGSHSAAGSPAEPALRGVRSISQAASESGCDCS
jgi:hypothetical protein